MHRVHPQLVSSLSAVPFLKTDDDADRILLTSRQREELVRIGTRMRLPPRTIVYREDSPADRVFAITEGAVKSYRELPSGKRVVCAFLFARDLFGLAQNGRYVNSVQTITRVTAYGLPLDELMALLKHDGDLQFVFLAKVTHELREAQRRAIVINRRDAPGRLAMFLALMCRRVEAGARIDRGIPLPMTRSDIADFLGLSLESVSRAAATLERRGLVTFDGRHLARIMNPRALAKLVAAV